MWSPTHVRVTVCRARKLKIKGKNDAYVTIKLGTELYQTSVCERTTQPEWLEQCDFALGGKSSTVKLKVYHRNFLGRDDFLGQVSVDVQEFKVHDRPRSRWYALLNKPSSKVPEKFRGELELLVSFHVHSISSSHLTLSRSAGKTSLKGLAQHVDKMTSQFGSGKRNTARLGLRSISKRETSSSSAVARSRSMSYNTRPRQDDVNDSRRGMSESLSSESTDDDDEATDVKMSPSVVGVKKARNGRLLKSSFLSQSSLEITSSRKLEMSVNSVISTLREEDSEPQKAEVTVATRDETCRASSIHRESANGNNESNVDTKEHASDPTRPPLSQLENVDSTAPNDEQEVDESKTPWHRQTLSFGDISSASSTTDLPHSCPITGTPVTADCEAAPDQLGDAFVGDLQYVDERFNAAQVAVFQSSETEQTNTTTRELAHSPVQTSSELLRTVSSEARETTDEVNTMNDNDQQNTVQTISEVAQDRRVTLRDDQDAVHVEEQSVGQQLETSLIGRTYEESTRDEHTSTVPQQRWSPSQAATVRDYIDCSREELLQKLIQQRHQLRQRDAHIADLERYIDELLVKVIDLQPLLLSHDTPPPPRPPTSQPRNSEPRTNTTTPTRHKSPFIRQTATQRSDSGLKKFAVGPLQTLLK